MSSTDSQSRKYILTINDPREHSFGHDLVIDRMHLFHIRRDLELRELWNRLGAAILTKVLITQALKKGAVVAIADFKGGVDFPPAWREKCQMCFDEKTLLTLLDGYIAELEARKQAFSKSGQPNLDAYNRAMGVNIPRYILACDEIAEVLDKTGLAKEQRPDASILSGQIRNNINCRVCGRADNVLSQIILDSTDAAEQIPKDAKGRFMLHDGTVFQGYWLDEGGLTGGLP